MVRRETSSSTSQIPPFRLYGTKCPEGLSVIPPRLGDGLAVLGGLVAHLLVGRHPFPDRKLRHGKNTVLVGLSSDQAIYEEGLPVEPGETKVFKFAGESIDLYGRSNGFACNVTVWE